MGTIARGHVADRPFARTIYAIAAKRFTGLLVLTQGGRSYTLSWREGLVAAANSSSPADSIGRIALTAGLVTSTQLADAMRHARASMGSDSAQLELLADVARLSPQQVLMVKRRAFAHRAVRVFALPEASFVLDDASSLPQDPDLDPLRVHWLISHGLRTHYSEERLETELRAVAGASFQLVPGAHERLGSFGFGGSTRPLLDALAAGAATLDELDAVCSQLTRKAIMAVLYALLATDVVSASRPAGAAQAAPARPAGSARSGAVPVARPAGDTQPTAALGSRAVQIPAASRPTSEAKTSAAERAAEVRALIERKSREMDTDADYYQLLGVVRDASAAAIRVAYFELAKVLHPDRLRALGIADRPAEAQRLFAHINQIYAVLSNPARRAEYQAVLDAGGAKAVKQRDAEAEEATSSLIAAEQSFREGELAARRERWSEALDCFQRAVELNPDEAEHHALYAWALWCATEDKQSIANQSKQSFKRAFSLSPRNLASYFYRGRLAIAMNDLELARDCFRHVLELNPEHTEAKLQVRLLESRLSKGEEKKGILDLLKRR